MKAKQVIWSFCFWAILISGSLRAETLTLAVGDWAPYTSKADSQARIAQTIVSETFGRAGITVDYAYVPWKRAFNLTRDGKYDGSFPWFKTDDRARDFVFPKSALIKQAYVFFHLRDRDFQWDTLSDLKKFKIGVLSGEFTEKLLRDNGGPIEPLADGPANFKKLVSGRIDAYPTSRIVGYYAVRRMFPPETAATITHHPTPLKEDDMYIMFSKSSGGRLAEVFTKAFDALRSSGRYDEIMNGSPAGSAP